MEGNDFFTKWMKLLESYQQEIESSVEDIRKHKADIQQIKQEIYDRCTTGRFVTDPNRIIISAPEVIIGNVDKGGQLKSGPSRITLRGTDVCLEGVGEGGTVESRATNIAQVAIDPGPEGLDEILHPTAHIVQQARSVVIDSNDSTEVYTHSAYDHLPASGVAIHSDSQINIDASRSLTERTEQITQRMAAAQKEITELKLQATTAKLDIGKTIGELQGLWKMQGVLTADDAVTNTSISDLDELHEEMENSSFLFFRQVDGYLNTLARLAERLRRLRGLKAQKSTQSEADYKKKATGAQLHLNGEYIDMTCFDGDNNLRENDDTAIKLRSKNITLSSADVKGANIKEGKITLHAENVELSTHDNIVKDKNTDMPAAGRLSINSKEIEVTAIDSEQKENQEPTEKALTEAGRLSIRVKDMDISGTDKEGKPVGTLSVNEKTTTLGTWKKDDSGKEEVEEGTLAVKTTAVSVGVADKTKTIALESEEVTAKAKKSYKADQDGKASLELNNDKVVLKGSNKEISGGKSEFKDDADFKGNLTAKQAKIQQVEVQTKFKSPTIQDGM